MTANSKEREFRYICQWFGEFSELQREDFVPVLVDYLTKEEIYMNGVVNSLSNAGCDDKPMSLYQCRIKLFKEWSPKWPEEMKMKLKEKVIELDPKIGEKLECELSTLGKGNGYLPNGQENGHDDIEHNKSESNGLKEDETEKCETMGEQILQPQQQDAENEAAVENNVEAAAEGDAVEIKAE